MKFSNIALRFLMFFVLCSFIITCSMIIMLKDADIGEQLLRRRAPMVFLNVFVLSALLAGSDALIRYYSEIRPARRILDGVKAISGGDFSCRIDRFPDSGLTHIYNPIIDGINTMAQELSNTELLRTDFVSNVSHELKTPLSVISAHCEILQDPSLSQEERTQRIQVILKSVRNLSDLITNILRLNRIEHQEIITDRKSFNLSNALIECVLSFESTWEAKGLGIQADIDDDVCVNGDSELLDIVWKNLLSNAIKFTEKGGTISVSLKGKGGSAVVSVSDTGCGMSEQTGRHIFEKFYQGDTSHATEGNGLGLSMVRRIVDLHQGQIEVESQLGKGSTFTVRLGGMDV